ncbi:hypothetical protein I79_005645 [Cricetulus griseus]|uniref:Uncharacterized protein n=1 Tax=Cricetulus griseus TaxID=10029 RepID=G3H5Q9_CRIGR|nr:hypothetical protein I79_005645 [Cricetulus griseus]
MLPRILRIPARERTILSSATRLGPGSYCNRGESDTAGQDDPASSPGGRTLEGAEPWLWGAQQP